jgi:flagellar basal body-associated protein FliL
MAEEGAPEKPVKKGGAATTAIIVVVVAVVEGAAFFAATKFFGPAPAATYGAENNHVLPPEPVQNEPPAALAEVSLLKGFRVPNNKSGRTIIYDFDISVAVPESRKSAFEELVRNRDAEIRDRAFQIIRQARPRVLEEDDFATLRALLKRALSEIAGDEDLIQRVLIPRCLPLPGE